MLFSERKALHARIVSFVEALPEPMPIDRIEMVAHHAYHAELWDAAFRYLKTAGANAMDRANIREAAALFERALTAGKHLPQSRDLLEQVIDLRFELRNALWSIGLFERILVHLDEADQFARKLADSSRIGWISVFRSASLWQLGRRDEAIAAAEEGIRINESAADLSLQIGASFYLGCAHVTSGNHRESVQLFDSIVQATEGPLMSERCGLPFVPAVVARSWLVWVLAERGEFADGAAYGTKALEIAEQVGHPFNLAHIYYDLGYFYGVKGEREKALEAQDRAFSFVTDWNLSYLSPFVGGFLADAQARSGRLPEAIELFEQSARGYEAIGLGLFRSLISVQHAHALKLAGRNSDAAAMARQAYELACRRQERGHQAHALHMLGEIALADANDSSEIAAGHLREALEITQALQMRPLQAHCHRSLAAVAMQMNDVQASQHHEREAITAYRALQMDRFVKSLS